jgi:hypothetical protein
MYPYSTSLRAECVVCQVATSRMNRSQCRFRIRTNCEYLVPNEQARLSHGRRVQTLTNQTTAAEVVQTCVYCMVKSFVER